MGVAPQSLDQIYKITPISTVWTMKVAYQLSDLEDSTATEKDRNKETSVEK